MDFVVLKVNGKDVSSASHEDTIAAFTTAQEPIVVEVLKRLPRQQSQQQQPIQRDMSSVVPVFNDISTQTEWTGLAWDPQSAGLVPFTQNNQIESELNQGHLLLPNDVGNQYSTIGGDQEAEDDDGCEVEYEEVTLHRSPNDSKLGLTLGYGAPDEPDTDIYISEIEADSIAAKDGRIQKLDQLLQVNGVDVRSRDQVVSLFSERRPDFTLLLARTQIPVDEFLLDEQSADFQGFNDLLEQDEEDITTDTGTTENAHLEKDSGVGRTDESTKNDESSDHEVADNFPFPRELNPNDPDSLFSRVSYGVKDEDCCTDDIVLKQEIRRFRSELSNKGMTLAPLCRFQSDASLDREMALLNKEMENIQLECETLVHRHLESQQKGFDSSNNTRCQLEHVYVNLSDLHAARAGQDPISPLSKKETVERWVNSMFLPRKCFNGQKDRDSSSAYNTADSSGSGPLTLELTPMSRFNEVYGSVMSLVSPKMEDKGTQLRDSDVASMFSCDSCRRCCKALVERENVSPVLSPSSKNGTGNNNIPNMINSSNNKINRSYQQLMERDLTFDQLKEERNKNYVSFFPTPNTMYTNQANLQHTIWLQQQMLRQAMTQQKVSNNSSSHSGSSTPNSVSNRAIGINPKHVISPVNKLQSPPGNHGINGYHMSSSPSKSGTLSTVHEDEEMKMEWKVKRRADGTRYITRRPVRNRLLKARAMKILEERAGMTTDDDAMSELKTGRYWSKEERKRHLEKARDRKRKEMVIRSKMASVKEQGEEADDTKKEINILELSHKKMMKRRGKVVFDDFTTIQEVLAHGAKVTNTGTKPLGLLTVTTV